MPADLHERVEQMARMVVLSDSGDLEGLVALREQAVALASELAGPDAGACADLANKVGALAEAIVLRSAPDVDLAFREIGETIERLQAASRDDGADPGPRAEPEAPDDRDLIVAWISACEGMLSDLEGRLLALERSPADPDAIAEIRRMMHTLKGECGVLSLHAAQALCHEAESLIDERLQAGLAVPIDPFLALLDWMKDYVTGLSADHSLKPKDPQRVMAAIRDARATGAVAPAAPPPPAGAPAASLGPAPSGAAEPLRFAAQPGTEENLPDFLCEAKDHLVNSEEALLALDQDRSNTELINTVFRAFHTIKGVSGFMALGPIVSLAHSAEQLLDGARSATIRLGREELDLILASCDMMSRLLGVLEGAPGPTRAEFDDLVRRLDLAAAPDAPGPSAPPAPPTPAPARESEPDPAPPDADDEPAAARPSGSPGAPAPEPEGSGAARLRKTDQTVKVNTSRMDSLVTMVGELVIAQQMVVQDVAATPGAGQRVQRSLGHMGSMIRDLQEVAMSLRMVNLRGTFQKMTRLVRDVSQKAGKQIEVVTEGEDVELDRNVVEAITDPLVHMVRNSCDHGVEGADERRAAGKPPKGRLTLRAYHAGGSIVIEIADDGRGLRRDKLLAKAKSRGIIPQDADEASMPDAEVFSLIFLPGFSTADRVTDISGRGVGMDVVRRNIEALRGKVEIRSTPGAGATFLLRLPLTMAIIDGMVVRVGSQRYVLPTLSIQQSFRPKPDDVRTVVGVGEMVRVRGSMLPIYRLNRVLDLREGHDDIADALLIVMEADDSRFCLLVDEILGQHQVVIKTLTQTGQQLKGVSGGAILGDGRVALILEVAQVVALARDTPARPAGAPRPHDRADAREQTH